MKLSRQFVSAPVPSDTDIEEEEEEEPSLENAATYFQANFHIGGFRLWGGPAQQLPEPPPEQTEETEEELSSDEQAEQDAAAAEEAARRKYEKYFKVFTKVYSSSDGNQHSFWQIF